jgi:hypothetical protein
MVPVDNSVELPKTKIWGWREGLLCCSFIFAYLSHVIRQNNIVSHYLSNWKGLLSAV